MEHSKAIFKVLKEWVKKMPKWICLCLFVLILTLVTLPFNMAKACCYGGGEELAAIQTVQTGTTLNPVSPLTQQIQLIQPSPVIPGGRGYMLPQSVVLKDSSGNPVSGIPVKFEVFSDNYVNATMRGFDSKIITVSTDANGLASAANTYPDYKGEGFQLYSKYNSMVRPLKVKASVDGISPITFNVEVGTYGSRIEDITPPNISVSAKDSTGKDYIAGTWTKNSVTVHYTAMDTIAGIKSCTSDQVFSNEGANQVALGKAVDNAATSDNDVNHTSSITFGPINIDKSAPVTTAVVKTSSEYVWNNSSAEITFNAVDSVSGSEAIYYKIGDSEAIKTNGNIATANIIAEGITNVTYWSVDKAGNTENEKTITVKVDKTPPTLDYTLSPQKNENGWISSDVSVNLKAMDKNSGVKEIHYIVGEAGVEQIAPKSEATFFINKEGVIPVVFWTVDNVGNASNKQKIEVKIDKTAPIITVPKDISDIEATAVNTPINIGKATTSDVSEVIITNDAPTGGFQIGTTKITWTAKDQVGRVSSATQTVTVKDTVKPVLIVPGDKVYEAEGYKTHINLQDATATDIFPVNVTNDAITEGFPIGKTKVIWTAKDANGNVVTGVQYIIVVDTIKPELKVPADVKVEATGTNTVVDIGQATGNDKFKVTITNNALAYYPVGTTKVGWKATDENGNVTIIEQNIVVQDTKNPVLNIPKDIEVEADAVRTVVKIGEATAKDEFRVTITNDAPVDFAVGTTIVTWKAVDENRNVTTLEQKITVKDTKKPELIVPKDITCEAKAIKTPIQIGDAKSADIFKVTITNNAPKEFPIAKTVVTWKATDENGNVSEGTQVVTVVDTTKPELKLPKDIIKEATGIRTLVDLGEAIATDAFNVTITKDAPVDYGVGATKVTWKAVDENGNISTLVQNVTIVDTTKPELIIPKDIVKEATALKTPVEIGTATANDIFKVTVTNDAPVDYQVGTTKITWNAVDENGNVTTLVQNVTIVDATKPQLNIPKDIIKEATGLRTPVEIGNATGTDIFKLTITNNAPADYQVGTTKVTWKAVDQNGNITTLDQNVTIVDTTKPELNIPKDVIKEATGLRTPVDIGEATTKDIFKVKITNDAPIDYHLGKTIVTWTVVDENGNVTTLAQNVTIVDTTKPVLVIPKDIVQETTAVRTPVVLGTATATDIFKVTVKNDAPADYVVGTTKVTWTAVDENGNITTAVQNVTIVDTTKPVLIIAKDIVQEATAVRTPVVLGTSTATDIFKVTLTNNAPADYGIGTTKVTWTAVDENGNVTTLVQNVTIVDTTRPEIVAPKNIVKEATGVRTPVEINAAIATDIFKVAVTSDAPSDYKIGTTKVTWTAVDENGNVTTAEQYVTIVDTTKPDLAIPKDIVKEATAVKTPLELGNATGTDIFKATIKNDAPKDYQIGTTKVTWTAVDENGNETTLVQNVTIVDTTKPELIIPKDIVKEATAVKTPVEINTATANDIFKVTVTSDALTEYPIGITKVTWKAVDENGNVTTGEQYVTIVDTIKPELTIPKDIVTKATARRTPVDIGLATSTDIFKVKIMNDAPKDYTIGKTEVTWSAVDDNGNVTRLVQNVTIIDSDVPMLTIPKDIVKEATGIKTPVAIGVATATDIFEVKMSNDAPEDYPIGTTIVKWTALDENGNAITLEQKITIVDTTKPELIIPKDIVKEATGLNTQVNLGSATATDIFKVTITNNSPKDYTVGTTKVIWTAVDENGNVITLVQNVTIVDTTKPELVIPKDIVKEATAVRTPVDLGKATATDIFKATVTNNAPVDYPIGETKVTWTVVDENGNVTTLVQNVTIVDTTKPELVIPKDIVKEATGVITPVEIGNATATDIFKVIITKDAPENYKIGTTKVTWTAVDENGNVTTLVQNVTIVDTTKPEVVIPKDIIKEANGINTPVDIGLATAVDIFKVTITNNAPKDYAIGTTKVTWTVVDENGNVTTAVQNVTIVDTTKPELVIPKDIVKEATSVRTPLVIGSATATDIFKVTISSDAPEDYKIGTTKVTWKALDENGNVTTLVQNVTIVDTTKPELIAPKDIVKEATAVKTSVELGNVTGTDIFKVTTKNDAPKDYAIGTTKVTWTAVDENGNVITAVQNVTIVDTTKPELIAPKDIVKEATAVRTPVEVGSPTVNDIFKVTTTNDALVDYAVGTTKVTWKAVDENGNVTVVVQKITIVDTIKPILKVPADITVCATGERTKLIIGDATVKDIFKVNITNDAPVDYPIGTTLVTWTVTDANGNVSTAVQRITVFQKLRLKAYNKTRTDVSKVIDPCIMVENVSRNTINLSDVTIRYYYTADTEENQTYWCDYAQVDSYSGSYSVTSCVRQTLIKGKGNSYYFEISFAKNAGSLKPGEKVIIYNTIQKSEWYTSYIQSNDYSFNPVATDFVDNNKIIVYYSDVIVGGIEP